MDVNWGTVIQTIIIAVCTWYMRSGSRNDSESVKRSTAAQSTSDEILKRVTAIENDMIILKALTTREFGIDHRGVKKGGDN